MESRQEMNSPKKLERNYNKLLSAVSLTFLGDGLTLIALPWIATSLTDNAFYVSLVSAAMVLPWLLFSLPAGVIIDRFSQKTLLVYTNIFRAVFIGLLSFIVFQGWINLPLLILSTFLIGITKVIFDSTAQATVPLIVRENQLEKANGYMFASITTMDDIVGKGLGGILISLGLFVPILIDATTALLSIPILLSIQGSLHTKNNTDTKEGKNRKMREDIITGVRWVWGHSLLRRLALLNIGLTTSFASVVAIQILFIQENLGLGSTGFGMLMAIAAIGAILGGQLAGRLKQRWGTKKGMLISVFVTGITLGSVGFMSNWMIVSILYVIGSFMVVIWNVFRLSLIQRIVPKELIGRVMSVFRLYLGE